MELREFAERILRSDDLDEKLRPPEEPLNDASPGESQRLTEPARPERLRFAPRKTAPPMPAPLSFVDPRKRAVAHHIMANHELQALEVMAAVLCAFPSAPSGFRRGLVDVMRDEQRHTRMHIERAAALGVEFGDYPVNGYIWKKSLEYRDVLDYLAGLPLTFETRNLDHTLEFEAAFLVAGDRRSAAVMRRIHEDEIAHVRFGIEWLRALKPADAGDWETYVAHLRWPLRPGKSVGKNFQREARAQAGLDADFLEHLSQSLDEDP